MNKMRSVEFEDKKIYVMLSLFGLTENDSKTFVVLHRRGGALSGAKVALLSGVTRQYVYTSLKKLSAMGFVDEQIVRGKALYTAYPPSKIVRIAEKKLLEAEELREELGHISQVESEQEFEVYSGDKEVIAYERNLVRTLPLNTKQYIIGGDSDTFLEYFGDFNDELNKHGAERGLESYYIASPEEMPWPQKAKEAQRSFNYRVLDILPKTMVSTVIRFDTVAMYSMATPPLVYVIKSKRVAADYKKHFDMLWNLAREVK